MFRLALLCAGCFQVSLAFTCTNSDQCKFGGKQGVCTAEKVCEFPDSDLAGADLSSVDLSRVDLTGVDLAGVDFAGADLATGGDLAVGGCALPQLLVTVEKLGTAAPGKVLRYHLPPVGPPEACTPLDGSGALGQYPWAAAKVGDRIAVGARDGVFLIDPMSDLVVASWPNNPQDFFPIDVAPLSTADGLEIAVAWAQNGDPALALYQLDLYLPAQASTAKHSWTAASLGLINVIGMTIDPWDPTLLMMLDDYPSSTPQAEEYADPFVPTVTGHFDEPNNLGMRTISSISVGGIERTVWAANGIYDAFYFMNAAAPSPSPTILFGPGKCSCTILHAVPDPNDSKTAFALCDGTGTQDRVVHRATFSTTTSMTDCTPVVLGTSLGVDDRITHLAIAMP
jgi:hypothetical protein